MMRAAISARVRVVFVGFLASSELAIAQQQYTLQAWRASQPSSHDPC